MIGDGRRPARLNRFLFRKTSQSKIRNWIRYVCAEVIFGTVLNEVVFRMQNEKIRASYIAHIYTYIP